FPVASGSFPQFSPDGRWVAYESSNTAGVEVYVQQFPSGRQWQVSKNGGGHVRWRPDGKELFYISLRGQLMAVPIDLAADGQKVQLGTPVALFTPPLLSRIVGSGYGQQYALSPDGQR